MFLQTQVKYLTSGFLDFTTTLSEVQKQKTNKQKTHYSLWTSLVAQTVKRLPAMRETWVRSLGQEDPLEKEMATHSSILA